MKSSSASSTLGLLACLFAWLQPVPLRAVEKPNIVFILCDDLGYGDVSALNPERGKIATPNLDRLAAQGMAFTDAHTSSSVCTPTRYGLLTGRYNWRSSLKKGVLYGFSTALIEEGRATVPEFLNKQGYKTACIGKWHLGMSMSTIDGKPPKAEFGKESIGQPLDADATNIDWKGTIQNGPNSAGFDDYFGISASLDMPPYIWIENNKFLGECTTVKSMHRPGPAHEDFEAADVLGTLTRKGVEFIQTHKDKPFFLYLPLTSPHTPFAVAKEWKGKSGLRPYADFVMETDWCIGEIVRAVEEAGLSERTLIIVTSHNGCSPAAKQGTKKIVFNGSEPKPVEPDKHYPNGIYRGIKSEVYEGGHRVLFLARWTGKVAPGQRCAETICLVDLYATCAELLEQKLTDAEAPDSVSFLPYLLGTAKGPLREATVHHSMDGKFAIRHGKWKLALCPGSGGFGDPYRNPKKAKELPEIQLYDLEADPGEINNVQDQHPDVVENLKNLLDRYIQDGRSTPGAKQSNDIAQKTQGGDE